MPRWHDPIARLLLTILLLGPAALCAQTEEPAIETTSVDEEQVTEPEIQGRLTITTDAPATITIDGEDFGLLQPGSSLVHETTREKGTVKGQSIENPAASASEKYSFEPESDEPEGDASAEPEKDEPEGDGLSGSESELPGDDASAEPEDEHADSDAPTRTQIDITLKIAKAVRTLNKRQRQSGVYADFKHGIMWRREDNKANVTWKAARRYCDELIFGGWSDWRLPTIEELDTLQALWSQAAFKTIDPIKTSACCQWSSSEIDEAGAWHYNFRFRRTFEGKKGFSYDLRALCVRPLSDEEIQDREAALAEKKKAKKRKKKKDAGEDELLGTVEEVSGTAPDDDLPRP